MKSTEPHLRRNPPERSGPVRNPLAAPRDIPRPSNGSPPQPMAAAEAVRGALENGVRTAYAVIDDYMRRGQEAARGIYNDSSRRGDMSDYKGSFGGAGYGTGGYGGGNNPWNPFTMMAEQWMMAMRAWTQAWSAFMPGMNPQQPWNPMSCAPGPSRISVNVASARPVEVTANIQPGADMFGLVSEPLRSEGANAHTIDPPVITRDAASIRIGLTIAADQPAGRYRGLIRKRSDDCVAGDLTVVVS